MTGRVHWTPGPPLAAGRRVIRGHAGENGIRAATNAVSRDSCPFLSVSNRVTSLRPRVIVGPSERSRRDGTISLLAIILIAMGILVPVVFMVAVWRVIRRLEPDDRGDDSGP